MSWAIHLVCGHDERHQPNNVSPEPGTKTFWSGNWDLSEDDAARLVGGWIYLHATKGSPSYYGGPVRAFSPVTVSGVARQRRIRFRFAPSFLAKGRRWRGQDHGRAWTGGLVEASLPHEAAPAA